MPAPRLRLLQMTNRGRALNVVIALLVLGQPAVFAAELTVAPMPGVRFNMTVESLLERRWKHVTRQSLDVSCGSAALATILHYQFGDAVTEDELIRAIFKQVAQKEVSQRGGFTLLDLKRAATELGYTVHGYKLGFQPLVELHTPALVPITIRGYRHFVVFRGMVGDRVVLADPAFGNLLVPDFLFQSIWKEMALVVTRKGSEPIPSKLEVTEADFSTAETPEALHDLLRQPFHFERHSDEF